MKHKLPVVALACALLAGAALATPVSSVTVNSVQSGPTYSTTATIETVTAGGWIYSDFSLPAAVAAVGSGAQRIYWGNSDPAPSPLTVDQVLNADIVSGALNPNASPSFGPLNVIFDRTITNAPGDDVFLFDIQATGTDTWTIRPITGGSVSSPVLGGTFTFSSVNVGGGDFGATGVRATFQSNAGHTNYTQDVVGIALDMDADLGGLGSLIGVQISSSNADPSVAIAGPLSMARPPMSPVALEISDSGTSRNILSVNIDRDGTGHGSYPIAELLNLRLTHFSTSYDATIWTPDSSTFPPTGTRHTYIEDATLNTAVTNPGVGSGLTGPPITNDPANNTPGMILSFPGMIINGPGADFVLIEADNDANRDPFVVSALPYDGSLSPIVIGAADYFRVTDENGININLGFQTRDALIGGHGAYSLDQLEAAPLTGGTNYGPEFGLYGVLIDLSDLGLPEGGFLSGLFIQSADGSNLVDPVFVAAIPFVPEPGTMALLGLGAAALARRRRRNA